MAKPGDNVVIKGSEQVTNWKKIGKNIWEARIDNSLFSDFNPFAINITGDWLGAGRDLHLGEVYSNEKPLIEVLSLDAVIENRWYADVKDDFTYIYADFGDVNPNMTLTEINVRPACFFPKTTGINYITVKGFKISQAATQWSPPTGEQVGIIGPNWSKGWIIEDCEISNSKCVGICLGKDRASGHNMWSLYYNKFGYMKRGFNREIETILKAIDLGWSKENIGSHIVRRNVIHDCGQAGIVGHMGGAFSLICDNEIYNINKTNGKLTGAETAGIKLHAAIDTRIERNFIRNSVRGIWLDWEAQGVHVFKNICVGNELSDLFIEVSHGPTLIYNNLFLSNKGLSIDSQGIAFFNNLFSGGIELGTSKDRYTPYHQPHSTKVKGFFENTGGDVRFYNNIFLAYNFGELIPGLAVYDKYPEYSDHIPTPYGYLNVYFPIWTYGNVYYQSGKPYKNEKSYTMLSDVVGRFDLIEKSDGWYLHLSYPEDVIKKAVTYNVNTKSLGQTFISEALFDNIDSTPFQLETDFFGNDRDLESPQAGPFEKTSTGDWLIWRK